MNIEEKIIAEIIAERKQHKSKSKEYKKLTSFLSRFRKKYKEALEGDYKKNLSLSDLLKDNGYKKESLVFLKKAASQTGCIDLEFKVAAFYPLGSDESTAAYKKLSPSFKADYVLGLNYHKRNDMVNGLPFIKKSAYRGYGKAQFILSQFFKEKGDIERSKEWLEAAELNCHDLNEYGLYT